jgi:cytochrome c peroxidase
MKHNLPNTSTPSRWLIGGVVLVCAVGIGIPLYFLSPGKATSVAANESPGLESSEPIQPIAPFAGLDPKKIALGRQLFDDSQLSHNNQVSCHTCHDLRTGGVDHRVRSIGIYGQVGIINAPTVLNSGFSFSQFWDGRAATLEDQVDEPVQSKIEMGSTWPEVIAKLKGSPAYVDAFHQIYADDVRKEHVKDSIAEFERSLSTPNSRFDRFLRHDANALTAREQQGYELFKSSGCSSCHQGMNVGGNMYQKMGVMTPYFAEGAKITPADRGRFNVTGDPRDLYMFKVPSLRNVALTAPYFHDGAADTLPDAVRMMAKYQLGHPLTPEEVELIVEFLKTLTGELNGKPL